MDIKCSKCGGLLHPIWYTEYETKMVSNYPTRTGRKRKACSHMECELGHAFTVDDSFDGPWVMDTSCKV